MFITQLQQIVQIAAEKEAENDAFKVFLQAANITDIDVLVSELNKQVEQAIDCTQCGNCCKTLLINVSKERSKQLANYLQQSVQKFEETYIEKGSNGMMLMNTIPCHFLNDNSCTVYEHRFDGCREFPGLNLPNFTQRLFTVFMHYTRCPIVFNVIEQLKITTGFADDLQ